MKKTPRDASPATTTASPGSATTRSSRVANSRRSASDTFDTGNSSVVRKNAAVRAASVFSTTSITASYFHFRSARSETSESAVAVAARASPPGRSTAPAPNASPVLTRRASDPAPRGAPNERASVSAPGRSGGRSRDESRADPGAGAETTDPGGFSPARLETARRSRPAPTSHRESSATSRLSRCGPSRRRHNASSPPTTAYAQSPRSPSRHTTDPAGWRSSVAASKTRARWRGWSPRNAGMSFAADTSSRSNDVSTSVVPLFRAS